MEDLAATVKELDARSASAAAAATSAASLRQRITALQVQILLAFQSSLRKCVWMHCARSWPPTAHVAAVAQG